MKIRLTNHFQLARLSGRLALTICGRASIKAGVLSYDFVDGKSSIFKYVMSSFQR